MYVIFVEAPITSWNKSVGFYTGCYTASINSNKGVWIGFTDRDEEWKNVKQFKTLKAAENKLKFLHKKIDKNGYMWSWKLSIQEITEEDLVK